ncbi:MAG: prolyl oligopeptidase family serine peptidase [Planctomycetia bacterium]|nr:prolyl oligopeptidase family serine peptidase [Planctomycetia bacterium]
MALIISAGSWLGAAEPAVESPGDAPLAEYFRRETGALRDACLDGIETLGDWESHRGEYRRQLLEMLGLDPLPAKTPLEPIVTGTVAHDEFTVENLHFQSRPGLYVTGNLYLPKGQSKPAPAILYVCGHAPAKKEGISYGNKTKYQHHGEWFARHGYVCLTIDTLQFGEIEGIHHGTHHLNRWWWLSRGYTPAGVEAWNCIRAIDYLQSRPEVDHEKIGMTGRSGGGAYSWWAAAIDDRVKAAVPVAGITDLENHVVDGCVENHCDCMFVVNTFRWDYPLVAALVAPRPLLITNTDSDRIFPLNGIVRTYEKAKRIYELYDAGDKIGLAIGPGGHRDTQDLQVPALRWFDRHLKGEDRVIETAAVPLLPMERLRVFAELPADQINTRIDELFVPAAKPAMASPAAAAAWAAQRDAWLAALRDKTFGGWPSTPEPLDVTEAWSADRDGVTLQAYDFTSQGPFRLRLYVASRTGLEKPERLVLDVLDQQGWSDFLGAYRAAFADTLPALPPEDTAAGKPPALSSAAFADAKQMLAANDWAIIFVAPRGVGPTAWDPRPKKQTHIRRRFYLLGQTLEGMQVYDVRRALQAIRTLPGQSESPLWLESRGEMAGVAVYASLFEPRITGLDLWNLPRSHRDGPALLNVQQTLDMPQAVAMAAERSQVVLHESADSPSDWKYPQAVTKTLGWPADRLRVMQK